ncbi:nSTAND1 domain-containing NTPase [Streptosporangium pseudovulgare]|uniref:Novel STAND NTPase 1 domain-containing protein n=1 Tax=Streptosporangium pseudovulgare TaxID=35765 RepID=A0ABQ2R0B4_9ACTN|nr:AAA family ATPase [Streptosporangium pseudovulgare]GGQ02186.1 hypothetical protein GCM10010140_35290 [Streptosporangium pseudovulgare]
MADGSGEDSAEATRERVSLALTRQMASGALRATPPTLLAVLSASALLPLALTEPSMTGAATLGIAAGVGTNVLSGVISDAVAALRRRAGPPTPAQAENELAERIERALTGDQARATLLRREIAALMREIDMAGIALEVAIKSGDRATRTQITRAFAELSEEFEEFSDLLTGIGDAAADIQRTLRRQDAEHRSDRERLREQSAQLMRVLEDLAILRQSGVRRHHGTAAGAGEPGAPQDSPVWESGSPYRGLWPFEVDHARIFYGREQETIRLVGALAERLNRPGPLIVTGASGAGKSSLLRAGLMPALARGLLAVPGAERWPRLLITATADPLGELAAALASLAGSLDPVTIRRSLADDPTRAALVVRQVLLAVGDTGGSRLVIVVDQFEEVFTLVTDRRIRDAFVTTLVAAATEPAGAAGQPGALVVMAVRGDFIDRCADTAALAPAMREGPFVLGPMTRAELRRAVVGPAEAAGLTLEAGLTESILDDVATPAVRGEAAESAGYGAGVLPLLSQALLATWENREGTRLTTRAYGEGGGVAKAVQTSAEAAYATLSTEAERATARTMFRQMAVVRGGRVTRRPVALTALDEAGGAARVLSAFADRRLVVLNEGTAEIAHDVLLTVWPRLREWLADDHASHVVHTQLTEDAAEWAAGGEDASFLYRGTRLAAVQQERARWESDPDRYPALTPEARRFVAAGTRAVTRSARVRRVVTAGLALLLVAALAGAGLAVSAAGTARMERDRADAQRGVDLSRRLSLQSVTIADTDPGAALMLAATAWDTAHTPEAGHAMINALARRGRGTLTTADDRISPAPAGVPENPISGYLDVMFSDVAFAPDGKILATAGGDGVVRLWDVAARRQVGWFSTGDHRVESVRFNPDGTRIATVDQQGMLRIWDSSTKVQLRAFDTGDWSIRRLAWSPDGITVATTGGAALLWDTHKGHRAGRLTSGGRTQVTFVAFDPAGKLAVTGEGDGTVRLWDAVTRKPFGRPLKGHTRWITGATFIPNGRILITSSQDRTVRMWDVERGTPLGRPIKVTGDGVSALALSGDGQTIATGTALDGVIQLWDLTSQRRIGPTLTGHGSSLAGVAGLAFGGDGSTLVSAGGDGSVRLWTTAGFRQVGPMLLGHKGSVETVAFSPDGRVLATAGGDKDIRLWDPATHRPEDPPLTGHTDGVQQVAFGPGGRTLVSIADYEADLWVWDVKARRRIGAPLVGHEASFNGGARGVAISRDGRWAATAGVDGTARLWDISRHTALGGPLRGHRSSGIEGVRGVAFSPDGATLATAGDDHTIRLWDVRTQRGLGTPLFGHTAAVHRVAFSPDGRHLLSGGADGTVRLWDVRAHRQAGRPFTGHTGTVRDVAFSPDGRVIATGGDDGTVRLWDLATRQQIGAAAHPDDGGVYAVAFSPNGRTLATGAANGVVWLWDVAIPSDLFRAACSAAGRSLTPQEWRQYLPGEPYRPVCGGR